MSLIELLGTLCVAAIIIYYCWNYNKPSSQKSVSLPPRAPGYIPLIGHLYQVMKPIPIHELFYNWSKEAGPTFTCYFGTQRWIILNSIDVIKDLIVERGTIYSSRNLPDTLVHDFLQGGKFR